MPRGFDPEAILHLPLMANPATMSPDGPRDAPVCFLWKAGALRMPAGASGSSVRRIAADPRCAVEIVRHDNPAGILLHLGFRGRASVGPMDPPRFRRCSPSISALTPAPGTPGSSTPWPASTTPAAA
ncbi:MAG: hypothetical protein ACK4GO_13965 [Gemmobacter sp.]